MWNPGEALGGAFLKVLVYRSTRNLIYRLIALWRPGWGRALPLVRFLDRYADQGTLNMPLYSNPRFGMNIRELEVQIRRVRRGGQDRPFELPYDFPPGSRELMNEYIGR